MSRKRSTRQPLADRMYETLFAQLMDGSRDAGEPLNIGALSRELDVSQTPLREALARLEYTGLVHRDPLRGYRVAPLFTQDELIKLMDARLVLEPALTLEAGKRTTPEFLAALLASIEELSEASKSADTSNFRGYWSADEEFHTLIAEQADNPFLATAYRSLGGQVQRFRLFAELGSSDAEFAAKEHRTIYEALAAGNPQLAAERMRDHVSGAKGRSLTDRQAVDDKQDSVP
ncbi:GntR family transcriptional regulator [Saccharomonospora sp. NPDC046836]|uniref:GntR family transcriptional regulator n=1 Tax=Saccharomonospora sp. NPDC046836 TaxID=3156921 RepID=UPI00340A93E1